MPCPDYPYGTPIGDRRVPLVYLAIHGLFTVPTSSCPGQARPDPPSQGTLWFLPVQYYLTLTPAVDR